MRRLSLFDRRVAASLLLAAGCGAVPSTGSRHQTRHQSRATPQAGKDTVGGSASSNDARLRAALTMATPTTYALATVCGVVHDVQVGAVGEDNIIQFVVVSNVLDPNEASSKFAGGGVNAPVVVGVGSGGGSNPYTAISGRGSRGGADAASAGASSAAGSSSGSSLNFGGLTSRGGGSAGSGSAGNRGALGGASSPSRLKASSATDDASLAVGSDPMAVIEAEKRFAMARQGHLYPSTGKDFYWVRCYGGEEELLYLQRTLMAGDFVRVEGNFKINKQKDGVQLRRANSGATSAANERCFPFIRVELGDAETTRAVEKHLAVVDATEGGKPRRSRMAPLKGTYALVKSGAVSIISKTHSSASASASSSGANAAAANRPL